METKRVLIADDEVRFLESLKVGLADRANLEVIAVTDGKQAIERLEAGNIDLVVTDLKMPDLGGFELVAYLGRKFPHIPVIVMTAFGSPHIEENLRMLGISHYLEKPLDFEELAESITGLLEAPHRGIKLKSSSAREVLRAIHEALQSSIGGEVVVRHGNHSGRVFTTRGKVAWINASSLKKTFFSHLVDEGALDAGELREVFRECKQTGRNFGETLIEWGLIEKERLRELLRGYASESLLQILSWSGAEVMFVPEERAYGGTLLFDLDELVSFPPESSEVAIEIPDAAAIKREADAAAEGARRVLQELAQLEEFLAAGVISPTGAMLAEVVTGETNIAAIGPLANDVLLEAQDASERMGVGRGNTVHIASPQVDILVRCHNEGADLAEREPGKAHVHLVLVLRKRPSLALAKLKLEQAGHLVAAHYR